MNGDINDYSNNGERKNGNREGTKISMKGKKIVSNSRSMWRHWCARRDMRNILQTGKLEPARNVRTCFEEYTLQETVRYILQGNNVQLLSWGTRRLFIHGERRQFPLFVRKVGIEVLWRFYAKDKAGFPTIVKKVGRTLFCEIVSELTKGDVKQRACVDCKLHNLVYENSDIIKRIIDNNVRDIKKRKQLRKKLKGVCEFLKYSYITHFNEDSSAWNIWGKLNGLNIRRVQRSFQFHGRSKTMDHWHHSQHREDIERRKRKVSTSHGPHH